MHELGIVCRKILVGLLEIPQPCFCGRDLVRVAECGFHDADEAAHVIKINAIIGNVRGHLVKGTVF